MEDWESSKSNYASLMIWDINRELQKSCDAYLQWKKRNTCKSRQWLCFGTKTQDDEVARSLSLGRHVQAIMEAGQEAFGMRFERGDSICHNLLEAQLLRVQQEIAIPLIDAALSRDATTIPKDAIITAANAIRRACLDALREQYARLKVPRSVPFLPPPRFSIQFCPYASMLQRDHNLPVQAHKVQPYDPYDERETCPHCDAHISVSQHSALPEYRRLLFMHHLPPEPVDEKDPTETHELKINFACSSCYKTFATPYAFLDHVYQRKIGSDLSCRRNWRCLDLQGVMVKDDQSDPAVVDKWLTNYLKKELTRIVASDKARDFVSGLTMHFPE